MPGLSRFLLSFCILGYIFCSSRAWHVKIPSNIKGLLGSCLVIPCKFDYYQYPPRRPDRVVWYQYAKHTYPLVYDDWHPKYVIDEFKGKTKIFSASGKTCSLQIYPVTWAHHRQKIYPWVDPENVGKSTYRFFDTTVTIEVTNTAEKPTIMITGDKKVGQSVLVECTVYHTCPTYPPTLTFGLQVQSHGVTHRPMSDGTYKTTLRATLPIMKEHQPVTCSVRHRSGQTASTTEILNAECSYSPLTISPTSDEFLEGHSSKVTCIASYTCPIHHPTLKWNYESMPASTDTSRAAAQWTTVSTLNFTASAKDHGKTLTCSGTFSGGQTQEVSITLRVKRTVMYQVGSSLPIAIPVSLVLIVIILAAVLIYKKRKTTDNSVKPPPRPEKRRSLWDRLSRRIPEVRERPPRPEKCRSIWSRLSSRTEDGRIGWQNERKPRKSFWDRFSRNQNNTVDFSVGYLNNATTVHYEAHTSKQRLPSPKDNRRTPHPARTQGTTAPDYPVYGNL
uniref:Ig-like domain-containing protein n=1 Tax=Monopterus albus TaxID=43700 RepID=A0A3Q3KG73_MONAL|nr:uncharacterized protein LOC109971707 isoform X3 [Monopterus albus]